MTPQYWAGFFDGEGNIHIHYRRLALKGRTYITFELRLTISQVDQTPLLLLQQQHGGGLKTHRTGCTQMTISGQNARNFLRAIAPFLIVKREEAHVALEFADLQEANPLRFEKGRHGPIPHSLELQAQKIALYDKMGAVRRNKGFSDRRRPKSWAN